MKTHSHLWYRFIEPKNFELAVKKALKNKKITSEISRFLKNRDEMTECLREAVIRGEFTTSEYRVKTIYEPKKRDIYILPFYPDRIIHHAMMNVLVPIWDPMFIRDSYSCRPGYGIHSASRRTMQFIRRNKYFLQCDIRKFYPSIVHDIMFGIIGKKIRDKRLLKIIENIVYSINAGGNLAPFPSKANGMPIGNFCSQWFGNLYMNEVDDFVKKNLHCDDYIRYCDDFLLFSDDKKQLNEWREKIRAFLCDNLRLTFSMAEIAPVSAGVGFLGYRHFPDIILMRKSTGTRIKRKMRRLMKLPPEIRNEPRIRGSIASMSGWLIHASPGNRRLSVLETSKPPKS
jgi:retron-type reverse transcriptase